MEKIYLFLCFLVILGLFIFFITEYVVERGKRRRAESRLSIIEAAIKGEILNLFYELDRAYMEDINDPAVAKALAKQLTKELDGLSALKEFIAGMKLIAPEKVQLLNNLMFSIYKEKGDDFWSRFYIEAVMTKDTEAKAWIINAISGLGVFPESSIMMRVVAGLEQKLAKGKYGTAFISYLEKEMKEANRILDQVSGVEE